MDFVHIKNYPLVKSNFSMMLKTPLVLMPHFLAVTPVLASSTDLLR